MVRTSLGVEAGVAIVRQVADAAEVEGLRRVGERLRRAEHPGVVRVLRSDALGTGWELVLEHGGPSLASVGRIGSLAELAAVGASVAATLADLHDRGSVHGRLDASRILVAEHRRPLLCGFAPSDDDPAEDVAALGVVLVGQLDALELTTNRDRRRRVALRSVAMRAQAQPPSRRPSARRLAAELEGVASPSPPSAALRHPLVLAGAVVAAVGLGWIARHGPSSSPPRPPAVAATSSTVPSCVATTGHPLTKASCGHAVRVDGAVVEVDSMPYAVALLGDEVAVGDWDCAGELRAAVLRPDTGELLVFAAFEPGVAPPVELAVRVVGARSLDVREPPDGCPVLGVLRHVDDP